MHISPGYLRTVGEYVHLNPVRAKWLRPEEPLRAYRWWGGRRPNWARAGGGDGAKLELAVKLRAETTMTLKWIAARLLMGT